MTSAISKSEDKVEDVEVETSSAVVEEEVVAPKELTPEEQMAELLNQKELIWDCVISCKQGSPDHKKFGDMYIAVCRKIFKLKYGLE